MSVEWELGEEMRRTGRWRRRQYYGKIGDARTPAERVGCEWREGSPR